MGATNAGLGKFLLGQPQTHTEREPPRLLVPRNAPRHDVKMADLPTQLNHHSLMALSKRQESISSFTATFWL